MRELKFRAWDRYEKEFAQNIDCLLDINTSERVFVLDDENGKLIIEQYTGLKDKNGKEIYEGDIVERKKLITAREMAVPGWGEDHIEIRRAAIVFEHGSFYGRSATSGIKADYSWDELETDFEVIGNVHENQKLLEGNE